MDIITQEQRFTRALLVALSGGVVAAGIMFADSAFRNDWGFVRAAVMGAFIAGLLLARGFGGQGAWGWFRAGLTFAACTVLGAAIAVPLLGMDAWMMDTGLAHIIAALAGMSMLGPVYVLSMVAEHYMIWAVWAAGFITAQSVLIWGR